MPFLNRYLVLYVFFLGRLPIAGQSDGGTTTGANAYCDSLNSGFISLINFTGNILHWEQSTDNQFSWQKLQNTTSTQSYVNLKQTTSFRAIVQDGSFPPDTSTVSTISVHVPGVAGMVTGGDRFCAGSNSGTLVLEGTNGSVVFWQFSENAGNWQNVPNTTYSLAYNNLLLTRDYRVVVQRVPGCDADTSASETIEIDETSDAGVISGADTVCYGSNGDTLKLSGYRGSIIEWLVSPDIGTTWDIIQNTNASYVYQTVTKSLWYAAAVKNGVCQADTTPPLLIASHPKIAVNAGPDATITRRESVLLQGEGEGVPRWTPANGLSDSLSFHPQASPGQTTVYKLTVTDINGCTATDSAVITVDIPIPSAITPNNDGINDFFEIYEVDQFENNSLKIYNRWGQLVFDAAPYKNDWNGNSNDGTRLSDGTYFYTFDYGGGNKAVTGYILIKR